MALLAKPALNQCIAIMQKYSATAIAQVNPDLPPIYEYHKGPKWRTSFPWVTIAYEGTEFDEASEQTRSQKLEIVVTLESGNFDSELAQDQAIDYLRVLDMIFSNMAGPPPSYNDWESALPIQHETVPSGMTTPFTTGSVKEIFIEHEEQSLVLREEIETPVIQVSLRIRFDLEEL